VGLLQDIQDGAVDSKVDLTKVLRQCMKLAYKLNHEPFRQWVDHEMNGYPSDAALPDYRKYVGEPRGTARNLAWQVTNAQIPMSAIPDEFLEMATYIHLRQGIGYYAKINQTQELGLYWPPEMVQIVNSRLDGNMTLVEVKVSVPRNFLDGMFEIIRNSILEFALKIEAENPDADQVPSGAQPIPLDRVTTLFLTSVNGGNALIGGAGQTQYQINDSSLGVLNSGTIKGVDSISLNTHGSKRKRRWF
jgi:hypothetical protein